MVFTNEEHQSFCGSFNIFWPYGLEFAHAGYDGTDEINIEDRIDVDDMKCHRNG